MPWKWLAAWVSGESTNSITSGNYPSSNIEVKNLIQINCVKFLKFRCANTTKTLIRISSTTYNDTLFENFRVFAKYF